MNANTYTTEQAAEYLEVTSARVRQMIADGILQTERFGRAHVISATALEVAKRRRTKPGPAPKEEAKQSRKASIKKGGKT